MGIVWFAESRSGVQCLSEARQSCRHAGVKTHACSPKSIWKLKGSYDL